MSRTQCKCFILKTSATAELFNLLNWFLPMTYNSLLCVLYLYIYFHFDLLKNDEGTSKINLYQVLSKVKHKKKFFLATGLCLMCRILDMFRYKNVLFISRFLTCLFQCETPKHQQGEHFITTGNYNVLIALTNIH